MIQSMQRSLMTRSEVHQELTEIVRDAPRCEEPLVYEPFSYFLSNLCQYLTKQYPHYKLHHFKEAFKDTDLHPIVIYNFANLIAYTSVHLKTRKDFDSKRRRCIIRNLKRVASSYVENPREDIIRRAGDYLFACCMVARGLNAKRMPAESYKSPMFL